MEREAERWGAAPFLQAGGLSLSNFSRTLGFCRIGSRCICGYCFLLCQGSGNQFSYHWQSGDEPPSLPRSFQTAERVRIGGWGVALLLYQAFLSATTTGCLLRLKVALAARATSLGQ